MRSLVRALVLVFGALGLAGLVGCSTGTVGSARSCASSVDYRGERYVAHGELQRMPATTGPAGTTTRVTCDDEFGETSRDGADQIDVTELRDVSLDRAFLGHDQLYVREDLDFPEAARSWFKPTTCDTSGPFEVTGQWLGVESPKQARFDGDLRPPYRITAWLSDGPAEYVDTRVTVHATERTEPQLGPEDVKRSLWEGGDVSALVHCEQGRFVADALSTPAGER